MILIYIYTHIYIHITYIYYIYTMCAKSLQSCPTLCDLMECSPSGSSIHGILQQVYWSGLLCLPPGDLSDP